MGPQKRLRRGAGVITGAIMDQKHMRLGVRQDHLQEGLVTVRVKPALDALIKQASREILNGAKYFGAFARKVSANPWPPAKKPARSR